MLIFIFWHSRTRFRWVKRFFSSLSITFHPVLDNRLVGNVKMSRSIGSATSVCHHIADNAKPEFWSISSGKMVLQSSLTLTAKSSDPTRKRGFANTELTCGFPQSGLS
ncbi:hypothetical protein DJ56_4169 [Yersinia pestis]|nr:hypothetical protein DJ56_4169 [Yersinia pestis]